MPRKSVTIEEFIPVKTMAAEHDKILRGNGTEKGLCEMNRLQAENHLNLKNNFDSFTQETVPILKDYIANKNKFIGAAKLALAIMFIITLLNGYITLTSKTEFSKSIEILNTISRQLDKNITVKKGGN